MEKQILVSITLDEFEGLQKKWIKDVFNEVQIELKSHPSSRDEYGTRNEVAKALKISLVTLNKLTKKGRLKSYRMMGRVLYNWTEVKSSLK
jgi:excisionase family DNA binding protein